MTGQGLFYLPLSAILLSLCLIGLYTKGLKESRLKKAIVLLAMLISLLATLSMIIYLFSSFR